MWLISVFISQVHVHYLIICLNDISDKQDVPLRIVTFSCKCISSLSSQGVFCINWYEKHLALSRPLIPFSSLSLLLDLHVWLQPIRLDRTCQTESDTFSLSMCKTSERFSELWQDKRTEVIVVYEGSLTFDPSVYIYTFLLKPPVNPTGIFEVWEWTLKTVNQHEPQATSLKTLQEREVFIIEMWVQWPSDGRLQEAGHVLNAFSLKLLPRAGRQRRLTLLSSSHFHSQLHRVSLLYLSACNLTCSHTAPVP